jgi:hypothetical protein
MGKININVSGSGNSFGNVVQGDGNTVSTLQENRAAFDIFSEQVTEHATRGGIDPEQVTALLGEVEKLKARLDAGEDETGLAASMKSLSAAFSWASPFLKILAQKILPNVALAIFG